MPKGDSRRRHFKYDKSGFIDLGPIKDVIPVNDGIMPINYGFFSETLNAVEGDEIDVLIFSNKVLEVGQEIEAEPIALLRREDGDDKIVAVDSSISEIEKWEDVNKDERKLIEDFFSYHHKFVAIEGIDDAKKYLANARQAFFTKDIAC